MQQLRQEDPYESLEHPTLMEPLDAWRSPPTRVRLREAAAEDLLLRIENLELGLLVTELPVPRGTQELPLEVSFIPGTTFVMRLMKPDQALPVALGAFELLPSPRAEELGLVLRTAWDLGGGEHGGELLAALAALHHGLHAEAIQRLERLAEVEGYEQVSRELRALALMEQGLDRTALELVDRPTG